MDRLTAMRVFAEVATGGSFRAASDKLDMSRAMVTRYVAEMEDWLQARLLQRTTRRVTDVQFNLLVVMRRIGHGVTATLAILEQDVNVLTG